jgi:hypothetical protein
LKKTNGNSGKTIINNNLLQSSTHREQPMPNILLENSYDKKYEPLGQLTWFENKVKYAQKHGYETSLNLVDNITRHLGWEKIYHTKDILENRDVDWVWVTGCDSMITNFDIKLESIIDNNYDIIIAKDQNNINVDSFLIKNSSKSIEFLQTIINSYENYVGHPWAENQCFIDLYHSAYSENIKIVPQRTLNSYNYSTLKHFPKKPNFDGLGFDGNWQPYDLLIHFVDQSLDHRLLLCQKYNYMIKNNLTIDKYEDDIIIITVSPHYYYDQFILHVNYENHTLTITRLDFPQGWGQHLILTYYNKIKKTYGIIDMKSSADNQTIDIKHILL